MARSTTPPDERNRWRTPPSRFAELVARYGPFALDAAADATNHLCPAWFGPGSAWAEDALAACWRLANDDYPTRVFVNPPYARGTIERFAYKAAEEARLGHARTTMLVLAGIEQPWFHELVWANDPGVLRPGVGLYLFRGRVRYLRADGSPGNSPSFPSVAVTFGGWQ